MNASHTPGPWYLVDDNGLHIMGAGKKIVAVLYGKEQIRNGPLLSAADDLLSALRDCLAYMENDIGGPDCCGPERAQARAAIAKATGAQE